VLAVYVPFFTVNCGENIKSLAFLWGGGYPSGVVGSWRMTSRAVERPGRLPKGGEQARIVFSFYPQAIPPSSNESRRDTGEVFREVSALDSLSHMLPY